CVQSSPMGAFDICLLETPARCAAQGGIDHGSGTCSPNPCPTTTTTSSSTTTTSTTPQICANCTGCGPSEGCVLVRGPLGVFQCACAPLPACGPSSAGSCGGNCPSGSLDCHLDTSNGQGLCNNLQNCLLKGSECTTDADCCSGLCDATGHCACRAAGAACTKALDCCSNTCGAGGCCIPTGSPCTTGSDCCSGTCDATGQCACLSPGAACADGSACCSGICQVGQCM